MASTIPCPLAGPPLMQEEDEADLLAATTPLTPLPFHRAARVPCLLACTDPHRRRTRRICLPPPRPLEPVCLVPGPLTTHPLSQEEDEADLLAATTPGLARPKPSKGTMAALKEFGKSIASGGKSGAGGGAGGADGDGPRGFLESVPNVRLRMWGDSATPRFRCADRPA